MTKAAFYFTIETDDIDNVDTEKIKQDIVDILTKNKDIKKIEIKKIF